MYEYYLVNNRRTVVFHTIHDGLRRILPRST